MGIRDSGFGAAVFRDRIHSACAPSLIGNGDAFARGALLCRIPNPEFRIPMTKRDVFRFLNEPRAMPGKVPLALRTNGDWN